MTGDIVPDRRKNVAAVVLAAGASTRLGEPKQLIEHAGVPLVRRAVMEAQRAGAHPVIVVLGAEAERVATALGTLDQVTVVINTRWKSGMASSLAAGLHAVTSSDGALIMLADQPLVDHEVLRVLIEAFGPDARIVASSYAGTLGVPIVIGREHFGELRKLEGDRGAGPWLESATGVTAIPFSAPILDIDTPEDAARLRAMDSSSVETS